MELKDLFYKFLRALRGGFVACRFVICNFLIIVFLIMTAPQRVFSKACPTPSLGEYTAYPPFVGQVIPPAVLILLDNSSSMNEFAYRTAGSGESADNPDESFNPSITYYGYFDPTKKYYYSTAAGGYFYEDALGNWNGNFLNYLTMKKMDVVRKVLVGGKSTSRVVRETKYLEVDDFGSDLYKRYAVANTYAPFSETRCFYFRRGTDEIRVSTKADGTCSDFTAGDSPYNIKVKLSDTDVPEGILQKNWNNMRFGLMVFNEGNKYEDVRGRNDGGEVRDDIPSSLGANADLITKIENLEPKTYVPLAESLYEATRYFRALRSAYSGVNYAPRDPVTPACQKNFVLILTGGESTKDRNLPGTCFSGETSSVTDPQGFDVQTWMDSIAELEGYPSQRCKGVPDPDPEGKKGTYYLEGVAYWSHVTDLRDGKGGTHNTSGTQNLSIFTVYAFGDSAVGRDILKKTAKYGGFEDTNGNNRPDLQSEWDRDNDGVPDTYFEASEGFALETKLTYAMADILRRASSGTSASIVSTGIEGEGAVYQAYFIPSKYEGAEERRWLGYLHSLFLDKYGNMREDTNRNATLDYTADYIVNIYFDTNVSETKVKRYQDKTGNGKTDDDVLIDTVSLTSIRPVWEAGKVLWEREPQGRLIKTTITGTEMMDFSVANASTLRPYLRASTVTEAEDIINYIRGRDFPGYRKRTVTIDGTSKVWKLGDITYSTPTLVSKPAENYDLIYGDKTYTAFRTKYANRRHVVYAGANDGMLHAFNGGKYNSTTHSFEGDGYELGQELWAFIPRDLLPHLKWLTDINYTHVYYVDLKPKVVDARIFSPDSTHPDGWGTVLIGGMRFGGKKICVSDSAFPGGKKWFYSSYFALDITDPLDPKLLWTYTHPDLVLTTSYPAVVRVGSQAEAGTWFVVFGSGPTSYDGTSTQKASIFVLNLKTGALERQFSSEIPMEDMKNAFMADPIATDVNLDYKVDVIYIGNTYCASDSNSKCLSSEWKGKMFRIATKPNAASEPSTNPNDWLLSTFFDAEQPISSAPSSAMDNKANLWVFFGTGRLWHTDDKSIDGTWRFYGVKDMCKPWLDPLAPACGSVITRADLYNSTSVDVCKGGAVTTCKSVYGTPNLWSDIMKNAGAKSGWYFDLRSKGEKALLKPLVIGGLVAWTTYTPPDVANLCAFEGTSTMYATYYETGTAYYQYALPQPETDTTVLRHYTLGVGVPASVGLVAIGSNKLVGFVQQSTGAIVQIEQITTPFAVKSGIIGWRTGGQ